VFRALASTSVAGEGTLDVHAHLARAGAVSADADPVVPACWIGAHEQIPYTFVPEGVAADHADSLAAGATGMGAGGGAALAGQGSGATAAGSNSSSGGGGGSGGNPKYCHKFARTGLCDNPKVRPPAAHVHMYTRRSAHRHTRTQTHRNTDISIHRHTETQTHRHTRPDVSVCVASLCVSLSWLGCSWEEGGQCLYPHVTAEELASRAAGGWRGGAGRVRGGAGRGRGGGARGGAGKAAGGGWGRGRGRGRGRTPAMPDV
jgi:hypothetical protein